MVSFATAIQTAARASSSAADPPPDAGLTAGLCAFDGVLHDFTGRHVRTVLLEGMDAASEVQRDTACCYACSVETDCEFWVRSTDRPTDADDAGEASLCWLRRSFRGFNASRTCIFDSTTQAGTRLCMFML